MPANRPENLGRKGPAARSALFGIGPPPRLVAPPELTEGERRVFADIVGDCEPDHFRGSDMPLLLAYVRATVLENRAAQELAKEPVTASGQISPWSIVHANALKSLLGLSLRLRLSPQGRKAVSTKRPMQMSYYERLAITGERYDEADQS